MFIKMPFFNRKRKHESYELSLDHMPEHVAIIMDGNGRWAKKRGLPRVAGHREGMTTIKKIVRHAAKYKIKVLTLYAFSTENWKRPKTEVDYLMKLPAEFLDTYLPELMENHIKVQTIGQLSDLPAHTREAIEMAIEKTSENDGLILNFALNYGGRAEILKAVREIATDVKKDQIKMEDIDEKTFSTYLYTHPLKDPDLLIRTSGEIRISNYLLWQLAYTEFWFTEVLWPDFDENHFEKALFDFQNRKRRYGGV
ncbi:undecaprenyl pyrophosphate synthetase [Melghiribacillus thermohalophilus]|uniref:Isoprenyl transferase n=1 Tax=Melghiribacillus thermohalophilus TaxID=1324956 RepID=A0A4R3NH02_9BACI|nr:isoprenyl transferase [Melghiribacillus thermohalophilus]TCT26738.1 undecaprenyl pyrophosphate synthetase [Melghiribacillus thermohalophilus]